MEVKSVHTKESRERVFEFAKDLGDTSVVRLPNSELEVSVCTVTLIETVDDSTIHEAHLKLLLTRGQDFTVTAKAPHLAFGHAFVSKDVGEELIFLTNEHVTEWYLTHVRRFSDGQFLLEFKSTF